MQFRPQRRHLAFQLVDAAHLLGDEQVAHVTSRQNRDFGCVARRGQRRVATYFLHEQMLANYRALYDETACSFNLPREGE